MLLEDSSSLTGMTNVVGKTFPLTDGGELIAEWTQ
jgi:hypothetical protein